MFLQFQSTSMFLFRRFFNNF
uniref:Uncharacterized protein n=1 Tax=Arundo donax TaxID=35708 RepID=A0A0A9FCG5_ARUDO